MQDIAINSVILKPPQTSDPGSRDASNCFDSNLKSWCSTDQSNVAWIRPVDAIHAMILELGDPPGFVDVKSVTLYTPQSVVEPVNVKVSASQIMNLKISFSRLSFPPFFQIKHTYIQKAISSNRM